jgi:hypothetical protein
MNKRLALAALSFAIALVVFVCALVILIATIHG